MSLDTNSYDSDDSLPDLFPSSKSFSSNNVSVGDIVFAKYKKLYWPALVRAVHPKIKKVSIWYADDPGKNFKIPLKKICTFSNKEMRAKITEDVKQAGCIQEHERLTFHAWRYMQRKTNGHKDDPLKYFDQTYPFFLVEDLKSKDPNVCIADDIKIPPLYLNHDKKESRKKSVRVLNDVSDDSELSADNEELSTDDEEISESNPAVKDYVKEINIQINQINDSSTIKYVDNIVECILSGKTEKHLMKVMSNSIPSKYYDTYIENINCGKNDINKVPYAGPIEDSPKLEEIINYLLCMYDKVTKNDKMAKKISETAAYFSNKKNISQYIVSVLLPESITSAISKVRKISLPKAACLFSKNTRSKKKAIANIFASQDSASQSTPKASNSKAKECLGEGEKRNSDSSICSPFKKLRVSKLNGLENSILDTSSTLEMKSNTSEVIPKSSGETTSIQNKKCHKRLDFRKIKSQKSEEILERKLDCDIEDHEIFKESNKKASPIKMSRKRKLDLEIAESPKSNEFVEDKIKCDISPNKNLNTSI